MPSQSVVAGQWRVRPTRARREREAVGADRREGGLDHRSRLSRLRDGSGRRPGRAPLDSRRPRDRSASTRHRPAISRGVARRRDRYRRAVRLADAISLRSRQRKLDLFLAELRPTCDTTVLDVGRRRDLAREDGGQSGCSTHNFLEERYPWPGPDDGARAPRRRALPRAIPADPLRPGRRLCAAVRRRRRSTSSSRTP